MGSSFETHIESGAAIIIIFMNILNIYYRVVTKQEIVRNLKLLLVVLKNVLSILHLPYIFYNYIHGIFKIGKFMLTLHNGDVGVTEWEFGGHRF